ncbi:MAG TPA: hypothetical protein VFS99_00025 [Xanthomonadaceae bacterium]|nr:hypothetical protein [Xanthomonadaceae bacterium]
MELLTTLLQVVLALFGVDMASSTHTHRDRIDGIDTLYSIATVESGIARFECLASASGHCFYTVFPASCAGAPALSGTRIGRCDAKPPRQFELPAGSRREIAGLSVEALCVRGDEARVAADCERPEAVAGL